MSASAFYLTLFILACIYGWTRKRECSRTDHIA